MTNLPDTASPAGRLDRPAGLGRWLNPAERKTLTKPQAARVALERAIGPTQATDHVSAWLKTIESDNTRKAYALDCLAFIDWLRERTSVPDAPVNLDAVSELIVAEYIDHMRETPTRLGKPLSTASRARRLSALSSMYRYLKRAKVVTQNPAVDVDRPKVSRAGMTPAITLAEADALLAAAKQSRYDADRDLALVATLVVQAIRIQEVIAANVKDLTTERGQRYLKVKFKGGKEDKLALDPTVAHLLDTHLGGRTTGPLIANNDGGRLNSDQAARILARLSHAAGLSRTVTPHMLRTTAISEWAEAGVPLHQIAHLVRHASTTTTERYLRRRNGDAQDRALTATLAARLPSLAMED